MVSSHSHSSKGMQEKWFEDGYWYKTDYFGGEAETEYLVAQFLKAAQIDGFIDYELVNPYTCRSKDFAPFPTQFITFYRLCKYKNISDEEINRISRLAAGEQLDFIFKVLSEEGFLREFLELKFAQLFEIDRLVLNNDRHWNNFGILRTGETSRLLTLFDFGSGLLSNNINVGAPEHIRIRKIKARTVSSSFNKQCALLPEYRFSIDSDFIKWLEERQTDKAKLFLRRLQTLGYIED